MRPTSTAIALAAVLAASLSASPAKAEDASVKARLDAKGIKFQVDEDGDYRVTYNYKSENRTQLVFVAGKVEEVSGFRVRSIFSPAARVGKDGINGDKAKELMSESYLNKLGSWEIGGDVLYFVIKLPEDISAEQLQAAMDIAAETADDMEIEISGDKDEL